MHYSGEKVSNWVHMLHHYKTRSQAGFIMVLMVVYSRRGFTTRPSGRDAARQKNKQKTSREFPSTAPSLLYKREVNQINKLAKIFIDWIMVNQPKTLNRLTSARLLSHWFDSKSYARRSFSKRLRIPCENSIKIGPRIARSAEWRMAKYRWKARWKPKNRCRQRRSQ